MNYKEMVIASLVYIAANNHDKGSHRSVHLQC